MNILNETKSYRLVERNGRYWIECKLPNCTPKARRVSKRDALRYLATLRTDFDGACVLDFGVGIYAKRRK